MKRAAVTPQSSITLDRGPEFEGQVLDTWACEHKLRSNFIRPGKPVENAYIESSTVGFATSA